MRHLTLLFAAVACVFGCNAQTAADTFDVGPYAVEYNGKENVKYQLRDNIDLYEFYELRRDTIIPEAVARPVKHAIQLSAHIGTNWYAPKEFGIEGVWKHKIARNLYFNGGISLNFTHVNSGDKSPRREFFEAGIPLQLEWSRLDSYRASVYGIFSLAPTVFTTVHSTKWADGKRVDDTKDTGFLFIPGLEFGGNIPLGKTILRVGVYGSYKIDCGSDAYRRFAGRAYIGAKIGVVI